MEFLRASFCRRHHSHRRCMPPHRRFSLPPPAGADVASSSCRHHPQRLSPLSQPPPSAIVTTTASSDCGWGKSNHGNAKACDNLAFDRSFVVFSFSSRGMLDSLQEKKKTMRGVAKSGASEELERRSQYLSSLIQRTRISEDGDQVKKEVVKAEVKPMRKEQQRKQEGDEEEEEKKKKGVREVDQCDDNPSLEQQQQKTPIVKVRAADMPVALQKRAFRYLQFVHAMFVKKVLTLRSSTLFYFQEFDSTYGPAWHCIVGTSFGSYVTHSLGGFLYFSIDKVYILLFRTAVEPIDSR
ncbi:hypothetical protein ZIOFF_039489 [Zingiber officinale]|uniref:Dynein light chain n=1 Tax=Zingiber officinale TaxID=94328 RepID=A0A8J5G2C1_ZINOF|nr:hypothetical protein ZIOFF_039489 [Zingiber officinale]